MTNYFGSLDLKKLKHLNLITVLIYNTRFIWILHIFYNNSSDYNFRYRFLDLVYKQIVHFRHLSLKRRKYRTGFTNRRKKDDRNEAEFKKKNTLKPVLQLVINEGKNVASHR